MKKTTKKCLSVAAFWVLGIVKLPFTVLTFVLTLIEFGIIWIMCVLAVISDHERTLEEMKAGLRFNGYGADCLSEMLNDWYEDLTGEGI